MHVASFSPAFFPVRTMEEVTAKLKLTSNRSPNTQNLRRQPHTEEDELYSNIYDYTIKPSCVCKNNLEKKPISKMRPWASFQESR